MNIKKVDDKPMVIHTKEKAKLHIKQEPEAKIKGRNVLVVDKTPNAAGVDKEIIKKSSAKDAVNNSMQKEEYSNQSKRHNGRDEVYFRQNSFGQTGF